MPPVYAGRMFTGDLIPRLRVLDRAAGWERQHGLFLRAIPPCFATVMFGLHFCQVFFDFPSYLNLCHRAADLVVGRGQVQSRQVTIYLSNSGRNDILFEVCEPL